MFFSQINQKINLDSQEKKLWRGRISTFTSCPTCCNWKSQENEENDFFGLQKLFYFAEVSVDWRVRLRFVQFSYETVFYLGDDIIFKN